MTKENTKFKDALEYLPKDGKDTDNPEVFETIRLALRLADRLTVEPSEGMIDAFIAERHAPFAEDTAVCKFKAMTAQLFKELDEVEK